MKVVKEVLAELPMCYAINMIQIDNRSFCIAASEDRQGKILLIDCETKAIFHVAGLAGGVMNIVPIPEENGAFLAIQGFYPIFQSEGAQLVKVNVSLTNALTLQAKVQTVINLPFLHRISLIGSPGQRKVIAATLCQKKAFTDDWSTSGGVYVVDLPDVPDGNAPHSVLLEGIHKNHGLFNRDTGLDKSVVVTGDEGIFEIEFHDSLGRVKKLMAGNVSDVYFFDLDGDGKEEMISIAPFHGDQLKLFKQRVEGWECVAERPLDFGHAVWCGEVGEIVYIVACSRGGKKETTIYKVISGNGNDFLLEAVYTDEGVGASNIVVHQENGAMALYASNHGKNEVARYFLSETK